jgi:hypothetical protein
MAGGALSNLVGEVGALDSAQIAHVMKIAITHSKSTGPQIIAGQFGYQAAFLSLAGIGLIPLVVFGYLMPETKNIAKARALASEATKNYSTVECTHPVSDDADLHKPECP